MEEVSVERRARRKCVRERKEGTATRMDILSEEEGEGEEEEG